MIVYHHNSPGWSETIRLAVPIEKFYGSHIRLEYRHCSSKLPFNLIINVIYKNIYFNATLTYCV